MIKPLTTDKPYPQLDEIKRDLKSAKILSESFASCNSKLAYVLQYRYAYFNFYRLKDKKTCALLESVRLAEDIHFNIMGKLLVRLGVDPVFTTFPPFKCDFFTTSNLSYSKTPTKTLKDAILNEMTSIAQYRAMLTKLENQKIIEVIERIIDDETLHLNSLKERLNQLNQKTTINANVE